MNVPGPVASSEQGASRPVFISYATADRKEALSVCKAIERRGTQCWISCRDVAPGENYQEEIVHSIRNARATVLVFSEAANNSDEIKKELSLASRYHVPVMALRIEDVEPSDAFAYELSTRQWIDAFEGWDQSIDSLVGKLDQIGAQSGVVIESHKSKHRRARIGSSLRNWAIVGAIAVLLVTVAAGGWLWTRSVPLTPPNLRFAGFKAIGPGIAPATVESLNQEITTAFGDRQIPLVQNEPDLLLRGSVQQLPQGVQVTAVIDDARRSETLWSQSRVLDEKQGDNPHLFSASLARTLDCVLDRLGRDRRPANAVHSTFIQACFDPEAPNGQVLDLGRQMAKRAPEFTGGWWAIADGAYGAATLVRVSVNGDSSVIDEKTQVEGAAAARQLIRLAPDDAEGYRLLAVLLPLTEAVERDRLFRESIAKRPEKCVCSYQDFGDFLLQAGMIKEALSVYQRGLDQGAPGSLSHWRVAMGQYLTGEHNASAATMINVEQAFGGIEIAKRKRPLIAMWDGRWKDVIGQLHLPDPDDQKAVDGALRALASGDRRQIDLAGRQLEQIPIRLETEFLLIPLLASLGRNDAVFRALDLSISRHGFYSAPGAVPGLSNPLLFDPRFQALSNDPRFGAYLQKAGFIAYWKQTHSRPDACNVPDAPPFCKTL